MAEAENKGLGRKKMNENQLLIIQETVNWRENVIYRGSTKGASLSDGRGDLFHQSQAYNKPGIADSNIPTASLKDLSLMWCKLKGGSPDTLFEKVSDSVQSLDNVDPTVVDWAIMGNVYEHGNYCEFLVGMYNVDKDPVIDFKRMSGDGFVMDGFYQKVKKTLKERNIIDAAEDDDVDFDYQFSDSEEEKEEEDDLTAYGYLQLAYDENIVASWIEKIAVRHVEDKNHMMGLMAYNASDPANLEIIIKKGGKKLIDLIIKLFEETNSAALVRNTSELANKVTNHPKVAEHGYEDSFLVAIFIAMYYWVPGNDRKNNRKQTTSFEITESRETVNNLVETIYNLKSVFSEDVIKASAKNSNLEDEQKQNIISYLENNKGSKPVDFLLHILKQLE